MKTSNITVKRDYSATSIYERDYRAEVIRIAKTRKTDVCLPPSASEDVVERNIEDGGRTDILATLADKEGTVRAALKKQAALAIDPDFPLNALDVTEHSNQQAFEDYKADNEALCSERDAAATDLVTTQASIGIIRAPRPNNFSATLQIAGVGFVLEATATVIIYVSGGMSLAQALAAAFTVSGINVWLGGSVMGGWLLPYCLKANAGWWHWPARALQVAFGAVVLAANLLVWDFRAKHGFDPNSPTAEADAMFSNLIGFGAFAIGILIATFYFFLFARCRDLYLEYGELGERLEDAKATVDLPAEDCRADIRKLEDNFRAEMDEQAKAADEAVRQSAQFLEAIKSEAKAFDTAQAGIVAVRQNVTELARQDARKILGIDTPAYYGVAVNYSHLLLPGIDVSEAEQRYKEHCDARDLLKSNIRDAKIQQKKITQDLFDRILTEFGS